jgi:uncharacterized protein YegL
MAKRPGGELATRPLHFIWIADCSGSMSIDGKIQALNNAIREALPHMQSVADENPNAEVLVRALKFSHGADWHIAKPTPLQTFQWRDLVADELQPPTPPNVDVIFLIDTSGSMSGEIEGVKRSCADFADRIAKEGANVRLGLIGFDIGGHWGGKEKNYTVHNLSRYTIGIWPLTSPVVFKRNVQSLSLGLFGGAGCYLADRDTVDIFPHVVAAFGTSRETGALAALGSLPGRRQAEVAGNNHSRVLVIISDEAGNQAGLSEIVAKLKKASITTHVMGVPNSAHVQLAEQTGGKFWDIFRGKYDFSGVFVGQVAETVAREAVKQLAGGVVSAGTDMGAALRAIAAQLKIPPMTDRALPPVLVLISDGQPTDNFAEGLQTLMAEPWGRKAVRIAIAIGKDADTTVLQKFIGHPELKPLQANTPEALVRSIKWVSTAVLKSASAPASQVTGSAPSSLNVPIPTPPRAVSPGSASDVW